MIAFCTLMVLSLKKIDRKLLLKIILLILHMEE